MIPTNGTASTTLFNMTTSGWDDDPASLPLAYYFYFDLGTGYDIVLSTGVDGSTSYLTNGSASASSTLPLGEGDDFNLTVGVRVTDITDASASASQIVYSRPPATLDTSEFVDLLKFAVDEDLSSSRFVKAAVRVRVAASVVNYVIKSSDNKTAVDQALATRSEFLNLTADLMSRSNINIATVTLQFSIIEAVVSVRPSTFSNAERYRFPHNRVQTVSDVAM